MIENYTYQGDELDLFRHATRWKRYYAGKLAPYIKGDVLEVGAGIGGTAPFLCTPATKSWTCLEPDARLLATLERALAARPLGVPITARHGTVSTLGAGEAFDTVLYIDVLEHIEEDHSELVHAAGRLRPGASLIVLAPAHNFLFSEFDKAVGHFRRYSRKTLVAATPPGVRLVRAFYLDSIGMFASLMNRAVLKASSPTIGQIQFWDTWIIPTSKLIDPLMGYAAGKTVIAVWTRG